MKRKNQAVFWSAVFVLLTLVFSTSLKSIVLAFFFVSFMFPVVLGTSIFFNRVLVPRFLLTGKRWKFGLYFTYLLIVSIYLELLVMILAFVILADYNVEHLGDMAADIYLLTVTLYLVVFMNSFITAFRTLQQRESEVRQLVDDARRNAVDSITIKVDRKNVPLETGSIALIESLGDYVKVHTADEEYITRMKISSFAKALPDNFLRIHRSFLVNRDHITSFNREEVVVADRPWPFGRKYKKDCLEVLEG